MKIVGKPEEPNPGESAVDLILSSELPKNAKAAAVKAILEDLTEEEKGGNGEGPPTPVWKKWIPYLLLGVLSLAPDSYQFLNEAETPPQIEDKEEILSAIQDTQAAIGGQITSIKSDLEVLSNRMDLVEKNLLKSQTSEEELAAALSDYIDHEGYKLQDLPDNVRLVLLKNEQKEIENRKKNSQ